jgi:hypothetical protein
MENTKIMKIEEQIRKVLREETNRMNVILRRLPSDKLEEIEEDFTSILNQASKEFKSGFKYGTDPRKLSLSNFKIKVISELIYTLELRNYLPNDISWSILYSHYVERIESRYENLKKY